MNEPNFFDALNNFANSVKSLNYSSAIEDANQRTQEIKASLMPDMQKRQTLSSLADNMFMHLTAAGAPPEMAAAVHRNIMPQTPSSAEQAILQGTMTGDKGMVEAGHQVQQSQENMKLRTIQATANIGEKSQMRQQAYGLKLETMKEDAAANRAGFLAANKPADATQLRKGADVVKMMRANDEFESTSKNYDVSNSMHMMNNSSITPNAWKNDNYLKIRASQEQWAIAKLGEEYTRMPNKSVLEDTIKTYFPQPGDGTATIKSKLEARHSLHQSGAAEAGPMAINTLAKAYPNVLNVFRDQTSNIKDPKFKLGGIKGSSRYQE